MKHKQATVEPVSNETVLNVNVLAARIVQVVFSHSLGALIIDVDVNRLLNS